MFIYCQYQSFYSEINITSFVLNAIFQNADKKRNEYIWLVGSVYSLRTKRILNHTLLNSIFIKSGLPIRKVSSAIQEFCVRKLSGIDSTCRTPWLYSDTLIHTLIVYKQFLLRIVLFINQQVIRHS